MKELLERVRSLRLIDKGNSIVSEMMNLEDHVNKLEPSKLNIKSDKLKVKSN